MNHIKSLLTIAAMTLATIATAQTQSVDQLYERFEQIRSSENPDTVTLRTLVEDWAKVTTEDPDYEKARIAYEFLKTYNENLETAQNEGFFKPGTFDNVISIADKAIAKYPDRLDIRLNNAHYYFICHQNEKALECLIEIIDHAKKNNGNWLWARNKPLENGFDEFEQHMMENYNIFFQSNDHQNAYKFIDHYAAAYPESLFARMNHATANMAIEDYDQALKELTALEKENPEEGFCLINLAQLYMIKGEEEKAKEYCKKVIALNDEEFTETARAILSSFETVKVDFDEIKEYMKDHEDEYRAIEKRFIAGDPEMSLRDLSILYFGHALTPECTSTQLWTINADSLLQNGKFEELLKACEETLAKHPASIAANLFASISSSQLDNPKAEFYYMRTNQLARLIYKSADNFWNLGNDVEVNNIELKDKDEHKVYKILWRADENAFVDYILDDKDKQQTLFFTNPVYFLGVDNQ